MSSSYMELMLPLLSCTSEDYWSLYEGPDDTNVLADKAITNVIKKYARRLRAENDAYQLDVLLCGMLTEAPHPDGRRHVAVSLHIAGKKGESAVVELAKAWMDNLFLPMIALSRLTQTELRSDETASLDNSDEPFDLMKYIRTQVAKREEHRCAITKYFDYIYGLSLPEARRTEEAPSNVVQTPMEAAQIIPFMLIDYPEKPFQATNTWNLLHAWTQIDISHPSVISPTNFIFMTLGEHYSFRRYNFYFDKEAYPDCPNNYKVRMANEQAWLSNMATSADVEFRTRDQSGVEPPNPQFLKIHASLAKILHSSGAARYYDKLEKIEEPGLRLDSENGSALLRCKLAMLAL